MLIRVGTGRSDKAAFAVKPHMATNSPKNAIFSPDAKGHIKGPGITEPIGKNAGRMVQALSDPKFITAVFGDQAHRAVRDKRKMLDSLGRRGRYSGALGFTQGGELQYAGEMDPRLFHTLVWTDPTIFEPANEKRLEALLKAAELAL